eukprot:CAMPEP_0113310904 /NCGR_PEP_ID=MMETSP0010_2-20120614/8364_1 /TAXON_ID=216773 ORGANISM="Corethron hystrix, Strain 308" /NCGR_SAMPLE_ID=MMETSP0010_2 /ASSEMBLY_ACC=CAM_ASM_000155 /LENGTH=48 /DNA_ID=CAMNT_0000166455 /DNA_START=1496 /DNA_END=1639 /DNA_ORIENTATION=- /assembly_acc=CAM_ASM_000155
MERGGVGKWTEGECTMRYSGHEEKKECDGGSCIIVQKRQYHDADFIEN